MKIMRFISAFAAALVMSAAYSCQKDIVKDNQKTDSKVVTLTASISDGATKTSLGEWTGSEYPVLWSADDAIAVVNNGRLFKFVISADDAGKSVADFVCAEAEGYDENLVLTAYYPYSAVTYSEGVITCEVPAVQAYAEGSFAQGAAPMAAGREAGSDEGLLFENIFGAIKLQLKGAEGETVSRIEIGSDVILAGSSVLSDDLTLTMPTEDAPSNVVLNFSIPVDISQTKEFIVSLPAGEHLLAFVATTSKGAYYKRTTSKKTLASGNIVKMPLIDLGAEDNDIRASMSIRYPEDNTDGVLIGRNVWANVNCGYHPTDYQWGKLYQWGRKDGCGYNDGGTYQETIIQTFYDGQYDWDGTGTCQPDPAVFYRSELTNATYHWMVGDGASDNTLWNTGTKDNPVKTVYDPCPDGWRVPDLSESLKLYSNVSPMVEVGSQNGHWCSGTAVYDVQMTAKVFMPFAGDRANGSGNCNGRNSQGRYWRSNATEFYFTETNWGGRNASRSLGLSVRCVKE